MDFKIFCEAYAKEINGEYRDYDGSRSIIIVPLKDGRFQTVTGHLKYNSEYEREMVQLKTKVCSISNNIPYQELLTESAEYPYSKFIIEDDFLKVEAVAFLEVTAEQVIKEMFMEIAQHADDWEFRITGKDIH
ncbi:MAG: hypothetical protein AAF616_15070 [Bacteroidota bacterium]